MSKKGLHLNGLEQSGVVNRLEIRSFYVNKYYNLFMNRYKWGGEISNEQVAYVMRKFWADGTIAGLKAKNTETAEAPAGIPVFCPYAVDTYNTYDFPVMVTLINKRDVPFIPSGLQEVNKDVVLGFAQRNHKGARWSISRLVDEVVEAEVAIRMNLEANKMPWVIATTPETEKKLQALFDKIHDGDSALYVSAEEVDKLKVLNNGSVYILDKLYNYKEARENAIREYLGFGNLGVNEKKEHLITGEIDVNNETTEQSKKSFLDCLKEFTEAMNDTFGFHLSVEINEDKPSGNYPNEEERTDEDETDEEV